MPPSKRQQVDGIVAELGRVGRIITDLQTRVLALLWVDSPDAKTDDAKTATETIQAKAWRKSQRGYTIDEIAEDLLLGKETVRNYLGQERRRHARASAVETAQIVAAPEPTAKKRGRGPGDPKTSRLLTTKAADGHAHVADILPNGNGTTTPGPDGHVHAIRGLELAPGPGNHRHQLTEVRA